MASRVALEGRAGRAPALHGSHETRVARWIRSDRNEVVRRRFLLRSTSAPARARPSAGRPAYLSALRVACPLKKWGQKRSMMGSLALRRRESKGRTLSSPRPTMR
jgi:hypothetical protein